MTDFKTLKSCSTDIFTFFGMQPTISEASQKDWVPSGSRRGFLSGRSGEQTPCAESQTQPECCFLLMPSPSSGQHRCKERKTDTQEFSCMQHDHSETFCNAQDSRSVGRRGEKAKRSLDGTKLHSGSAATSGFFCQYQTVSTQRS